MSSDLSSAGTLQRIKPENVPFSPDPVTDQKAAAWAESAAFDYLDKKYRSSNRFRKLLKLHARSVKFQRGGVIIREGDWGNSAFCVRTGTVAIERALSDESLGRLNVEKKGLFSLLSQLWNNSSVPEFRDHESYSSDQQLKQSQSSGAKTQVFLQDVDKIVNPNQLTTMGPGEFFGELAALGRMARTATIFAMEPAEGKEEVELLEIRWQGLRDMMRADGGFQDAIDDRFRHNALRVFLLASDLFTHLKDDEAAITEISQQVDLLTFGQYDRAASFKELASESAQSGVDNEPLIAEEGTESNGIIIVRSGVARVSQKHHQGHRTLNYLTPGGVFGFDEIVVDHDSDHPTQLRQSLRAIGYLMGVAIPSETVKKYVLEDPRSKYSREIKKQRQRIRQENRRKREYSLDEPFLSFVVEERFVNGTATMLINMDRCTRCDDCVRACATAHDNNPRFLRHGPTYNNLMVARACMHCHDPVCMIECPTGAISRRITAGEVTINDLTCIGCGTCSRNCPYEAIRMVEIRDQEGKFLRDNLSGDPIKKATKCDLCVDQVGGPSCQRACPHDALVRMDMSEVASLGQWYHR